MTVHTHYDGGQNAAGMRITSQDIAKVPVELRRRLGPQIKAAGQSTLAAARANASWSSRIPGALSLKVSFAQNRAGVTIVADTSRAPHARAFEGIVSDAWSHPLFGDRDFWYRQAARPYLRPAAQATGGVVVEQIIAAVDQALDAAGL